MFANRSMKRGNLAKSEQIRKNKQKKLPNQDRFSPEFHNLRSFVWCVKRNGKLIKRNCHI